MSKDAGSDATQGPRLLDHSYDGIAEYDNPLPGWWVWTFVACICFAPPYLIYYHGGAGASVAAEYAEEVRIYDEQEAARVMASGQVTEESLAALARDQKTLEVGRAVFLQNCVACHGDQGEGKIGPNLTDDAWIHGGTLVDIQRTIDRGVPEKGMLAWGKTLPPEQLLKVAAYVGSRRGLNVPGPLPPQGTPAQQTPAQQTPEKQTPEKQTPEKQTPEKASGSGS